MPLLRIDVEARVAQFQDAMASIERSAKKSAGGISSAFSHVNGTLAGLGVSVSVGALAALVKSSIDAADHINDLSKKTGVAVDVLGGIGFAAAQAGSSLDGVAGVIGKLNKSIAEAGSGNAQIGEAFKKLGVDVEDGTGGLKKADKILIELADKFPKYAEGPEKVAIANRIFKKSLEEVLPLLADGAASLQANIEYFQKYSGLTQDIAEKSDAFNDSLEKMHLLSGAAGNQIAAELLPTLQLLVDKMLEVKDSADGFGSVGKAINTAVEAVTVFGTNTSYVFKQVGNEIGGIAAQLEALLSADPGSLDRPASGFGRITTIAEMMREDAKAAREEVDRTTAEILSPNKGQVASEVMDALSPPKPKKPTADRLSSGGTDPATARLAAELREFERMNQRERELLSTRNELLQEYYQQDLISINDYYAARDGAAQEALKSQQANINKEIALLRNRKPKDDAERASNDSKVKDLQEKSAQLEAAYNTQVTRSIIDRTKSMKDFGQQIGEVNTQFLELQGRFEKVAGVRFDTEHAAASNRLSTERQAAVEAGDTVKVAEIDQAKQQLDLMRAAATAQGRINELLVEESRIRTDLEVATERADMAAENGSISQIEALKRISEARRQAGIDLQAAAKAFADAAAASPDKNLEEQAKRFQLAADKMAGSADLIRDKIQGAFQNGFESFFDKLISGTVSLKDAFKSLFSEIAADMAKMAIKNMSKDLFSTNGTFGGLVSAFAGLFNANGNAFNAGAVVPFAKGGIPSSIVDAPTFFGMAGGRMGLMGEAGPEAIMPLHRDQHGDLAIKMLAANGDDYLLPLARDGSGKLSVRERMVQRFANGGVFSTNTATALMPRTLRSTLPQIAALTVPVGGHGEGTINNTNVSVNVPQSTSQESAANIGARTAAALARANRRNN